VGQPGRWWAHSHSGQAGHSASGPIMTGQAAQQPRHSTRSNPSATAAPGAPPTRSSLSNQQPSGVVRKPRKPSHSASHFRAAQSNFTPDTHTLILRCVFHKAALWVASRLASCALGSQAVRTSPRLARDQLGGFPGMEIPRRAAKNKAQRVWPRRRRESEEFIAFIPRPTASGRPCCGGGLGVSGKTQESYDSPRAARPGSSSAASWPGCDDGVQARVSTLQTTLYLALHPSLRTISRWTTTSRLFTF
jgi:hypothetical protein